MISAVELVEVLQQLADETITGHTHYYSNVPSSTGHVVGDGKKGLLLEAHAWKDDINATATYIGSDAVQSLWSKYDGFVMWVEEGRLYVDPVTHVQDRLKAVCLGIAHGELAIWDIQYQQTIDMRDYLVTEVQHA
jgi:hypothetical protein